MDIDYIRGAWGGISVLASGVIVNTPLARSKLKRPIWRAAAAALLAGLLAIAGMMLLRFR